MIEQWHTKVYQIVHVVGTTVERREELGGGEKMTVIE